jgi:hypothetical protein
MNGVGQALGIDSNMSFNAGDFLAGVITLFSCCVGVLYALRINNAKTGGLGPTTAYTDRAN